MNRSCARTLGLVTLLAALALSLAVPALAGGPRKTTDDGVPIVWDTSTPVGYFVDRGPLGVLTNEAAVALLADAFATWENVPEASIRFRRAGQLQVDINDETYLTNAYPPLTSGISPVIFDHDGMILEGELGLGAQHDILGITSYDLIADGELRVVTVILNGLCFDGSSSGASACETTFDEFRGVVVHELGHFAGLDHTDLNREFVRDGRCSEDAALSCSVDLDCSGTCVYRTTNNAVIPTMFPVVTEDDSSMPVLHLDDRLALARLYPRAPFPTQGGTLQGQVFLSDGSPANGANVVVRNLADPFVLSASAVSGDVRPSGAGARDGWFRIEGLPVGNYSLEVRALNSSFTGAGSVGRFGRCVSDPTVACRCDPPDFSCVNDTECVPAGGGDCSRLTPPQLTSAAEYLSDTETNDGTTDLPGARRVLGLAAGATLASGIDVTLNDLATLTNVLANNACESATEVDPAGGIFGDRITSSSVDHFTVDLQASWQLRVDVDARDDGLTSTLTPAVRLLDQCGAPLTGLPVGDAATGRFGDDPALLYATDIDRTVTVVVTSINDATFDGSHTDNGPYVLRLITRPTTALSLPRLTPGGGLSTGAGLRSLGGIAGALGGSATGTQLIATPLLLPGPFADADADGIPDDADPCPNSADSDGDGVCDDLDNCDGVVNPLQHDGDADGLGDRCDAPSVVGVVPADGASGVFAASTISVKFSEPVAAASITSASVRLDQSAVQVPAQLSLGAGSRTATIDPDAALLLGTIYDVTIAAGIQDQDGATLGGTVTAQFTTSGTATPDIETSEIGTEYEGHEEAGPTNSAGRFGAAVAAGRDCNGDGIRDAIIAAPRADSDAGRVTIFFGSSTAVGGPPISSKLTLVGVGNDRAGTSVSFVSDINGDGISEVLIGAPGTSAAAATGRAYLLFGNQNLDQLVGPIDLSTIAGGGCNPCGIIFQGTNVDDRAGSAVSRAGDFNGDGIGDLMIGAPAADPPGGGRDDAGIVYVIYGSPTLSGTVQLDQVGGAIAGVRLLGESAGDGAGASLSDWPDATFDGRDDLLIGAPFADVGSATDCSLVPDAGIVYAVLGPGTPYSGDVDLRDVLGSVPGKVFLGVEADGQSGFSVWGRGDVTGDGEKDILIGAPRATFLGRIAAGRVLIIPSLKDDDPIKGDDLSNTNDSPSDSAGDTQGGTCDPFVRQLGEPPGGEAVTIFDLQGTIVGGQADGDLAGFSVATAADLDGDGIGEVLIGAPGHDASPGGLAGSIADAGRVYVLFGQPSRPVIDGQVTDLADAGSSLVGFVIEGVQADGRLGEAVTGTSDLDASGTADLVLGAPGSDVLPTDGSAFITEPIVSNETRDVGFAAGSPDTLQWSATSGASSYAVYRGDLATLQLDGGVRTSSATCIGDADGVPGLVDGAVPASGSGFWYQVAGVSAFGTGPYGFDSLGGLRRNSAAGVCP